MDDWRELAACAEVEGDIFFPERWASMAPAKRLCGGCEVRAECLADALVTGEQWGIRGGLSSRERNTIRKGTAA